MKIAALILGIIGSLASFGLGSVWLTDYNDNKNEIEKLSVTYSSLLNSPETTTLKTEFDAKITKFNKRGNASYALLLCGIIGLVASVLVFKQSKIAALILVLASIAPAIITMEALAGTFILFIAGALAFFVKPKALVA